MEHFGENFIKKWILDEIYEYLNFRNSFIFFMVFYFSFFWELILSFQGGHFGEKTIVA